MFDAVLEEVEDEEEDHLPNLGQEDDEDWDTDGMSIVSDDDDNLWGNHRGLRLVRLLLLFRVSEYSKPLNNRGRG